MRQDVFGRSYAIECLAESNPWRGFEFSYRTLIKNQEEHFDMANLGFIEHFFNDLPINLLINENGELLDEEKSFGSFIQERTQMGPRKQNLV